jgi:hypothetical protein
MYEALHSTKDLEFTTHTFNNPGVKRSGREADHSPQTSAGVKKMWIYTSTPSYAFMAEWLIS